MAEPSPAAGAFAFVEGTAVVLAAGARLAALAEGTAQRVGNRIGALDTLPSSALFDPFAAGIAAGQAAAADAPAEPAAPRRRAARTALASPAPAGTPPSPLIEAVQRGALAGIVQGMVDRVLSPADSAAGAAGGEARKAQNAATKPSATNRSPSALGAVAQATARAKAALPAGQVSPSDLPSLALQGTAGLGRLVADLIARVDVGQKPAAATQATPDPSSPVAAMIQIERQIGQMAIALVGAGVRKVTEPPPSRPTTAAPRAPSRLLQDINDIVAAATVTQPAPGAAASTPNSATPAAPGAPGPSEDDVAAAINRRLVDQAWLRGVDLR